MLHKNLSSI